MKKLRIALAIGMLLVLGMVSGARADEQSSSKVKPYPLDTCLVCGMKLSHMAKPLVFEYQGQEIKVCDKKEKRMFDKDPAKYMKKLEETEAKEKK